MKPISLVDKMKRHQRVGIERVIIILYDDLIWIYTDIAFMLLKPTRFQSDR